MFSQPILLTQYDIFSSDTANLMKNVMHYTLEIDYIEKSGLCSLPKLIEYKFALYCGKPFPSSNPVDHLFFIFFYHRHEG